MARYGRSFFMCFAPCSVDLTVANRSGHRNAQENIPALCPRAFVYQKFDRGHGRTCDPLTS